MPEILGIYEQVWPFIDRNHDDTHDDDDDDDDDGDGDDDDDDAGDDDDDGDESMDLGIHYFQTNSDEKRGRNIEDASRRGMHYCGP